MVSSFAGLQFFRVFRALGIQGFRCPVFRVLVLRLLGFRLGGVRIFRAQVLGF